MVNKATASITRSQEVPVSRARHALCDPAQPACIGPHLLWHGRVQLKGHTGCHVISGGLSAQGLLLPPRIILVLQGGWKSHHGRV